MDVECTGLCLSVCLALSPHHKQEQLLIIMFLYTARPRPSTRLPSASTSLAAPDLSFQGNTHLTVMITLCRLRCVLSCPSPKNEHVVTHWTYARAEMGDSLVAT